MATTACFIIVSRNDIPIYEAEVGSATKVWTSFLLLSFLFIYSLLVWLETQILRNEMYVIDFISFDYYFQCAMI